MSSYKNYNVDKPGIANPCFISWFVIFTFALTLFLVCLDTSLYNVNVSYFANINVFGLNSSVSVAQNVEKLDECEGKYIYVQHLPSKFNLDLLENCSTLNKWANMCESLVNSGLGPRLDEYDDTAVFSNNASWFGTNQFSLEVVFHNRMKQYGCLTNDSSKAAAVFVPFYAGLDAGRYLWSKDVATRDAAAIELVTYLKEKPEWNKMYGRDHFLIVGRITWDFRREGNGGSGWGNCLFVLPEVKNMTSLVIESSPWNRSDFAVPYPTYFHPSSDEEVFNWQGRMRRKNRSYYFSFAGAARPQFQDSIRNDIISQCLSSECKCCKFMKCVNALKNCGKPRNIMKLFQRSVFCLQPPGDSYTRRSAFDSILAGCIPVFFHPASAYVQYLWHLPKNYTKYSVFIPIEEIKKGNFSIEKRLLDIPKVEVEAMREEVIRLIPSLVYANPDSKSKSYEDAFDVSVKEVLNRVENIRIEMKKGTNSTYENFPEEYSWKYNFFGGLENHEWDKFFLRT